MIRFRRRNTSWLIMLGLLVGIAFLSTTVSVNVQIALLALFLAAVAASVLEPGARRMSLTDAMQRATRQQIRTSPQAREATERARRRGSYVDGELTLIDVGLIALQSGQEGMVMRRARSVSKDDDGVRPFITLHVGPQEADRNAIVRFEVVDHTGQEQYIYEMKTYLHDGEMNLLADHHLPLAGNHRIAGMGDWDLRVSVDGRLIGMHSFTLAPSLSERQRRLAPDEERGADESYILVEPEEEDIPLSLEQLLRNQGRRK